MGSNVSIAQAAGPDPEDRSDTGCRQDPDPPVSATVATLAPAASPWPRALLLLSLTYAALIVIFFGTVSQMVSTWYLSTTFNHGFMILPIVGWLVWERREALVKYVPRANFYGLIPFFICALGWTVASAAGVQSVKQFALVGMIQAATLCVLGWPLVRAMAFPLAFLLFAVPFGDFLVPTLQDVTAVFVVEALRIIDIPVYLDGVFISIPTGNFEVAEACSGVRFLIATVALGFLFSNLSFRTTWRRLVIIALAFTVPIVANGIRAFGIVYIAHVTDHKVAVGVDHLIYGWIFFAFVTVVLLAIGMTFRETDGDNDIYMPRAGDAVAGRFGGRAVVVAGLVVLVAASAPIYSQIALQRGVSVVDGTLTLPASSGGWVKTPAPTTDWRPQYKGTDASAMATYRKGNAEVHVYIGYYAYQRQDAELINWNNTLIQERRWQRVTSGTSVARIGQTPFDVSMVQLRGRGATRLVWGWYWLDGKLVADRYMAKIVEAKSKLLGASQAAAAVFIAADFQDRPEDAAKVLQTFLNEFSGLHAPIARLARP